MAKFGFKIPKTSHKALKKIESLLPNSSEDACVRWNTAADAMTNDMAAI
jgi:hypothetical protein